MPVVKGFSEEEIHNGKSPERTYVSKPFQDKTFERNDEGELVPKIRNVRIISKVIDSEEQYTFGQVKDEIVIRKTAKGRQEIIAKLFEDSRGIKVLSFQRYTSPSGKPHDLSFSFIGDEIGAVINLFRSLASVPLNNPTSTSIADKELHQTALSKDQIKKFIEENSSLISEVLENNITITDVITLGYRKKQLEAFEKLLTNKTYFQKAKAQKGLSRNEDLWQSFFEKNTWIFGYSLNYVFNSALEDKKLEQVVDGFDFNTAGKRADALLKTKGIIDSLCLAEIKTHETDLLKKIKTPYRPEAWQISDELAGAIAQVQKTSQKSIKNIATKTEIKDKAGNPTGENLFLYSPKSYLIVGSLSEFQTENGINEDKYSSFELFRQGLNKIEIITFDELFERAKFIVHNSENNNPLKDQTK